MGYDEDISWYRNLVENRKIAAEKERQAMMQGLSTIETKTLGVDEDVVRLLMRKELDGVRVQVTSKEFHRFFGALKAEAEPIKTSKKWGGMRYWNIIPGMIPVLPEATFDKVGEALVFPDGIVNLSFLRSVDLDKGVEFVIPGLIPASTLLSFRRGFSDKVNTFYAEFLKPEDTSVVVTTRRVGTF